MKKQLNISIDENILEQLKKEKKLRNRNISNLIETILLQYFREQGVKFED